MARFKVTYVLQGPSGVSTNGAPTAREIVCVRDDKSMQHLVKTVRGELATLRFIEVMGDNEKHHVIGSASVQCVDFDVL